MFVSGWGETKNENESDKMLRGVSVRYVARQYCLKAYPNLTSDQICAGGVGKDSCQGKVIWKNLFNFVENINFQVILEDHLQRMTN